MHEYHATLDTHIFFRQILFLIGSEEYSFQKKKRKKRKPSVQVEGFKKSSFSEKILPNKEVFTRQFLVLSAMR